MSPVPAAGRLGPGPTHNKEPVGQREARTEDSKLNNHRLSDMPVVFPYEGRAALFAELQHFSDQVGGLSFLGESLSLWEAILDYIF